MAAIPNQTLDVAFGAGYASLGTVGYRLYKSDGTDSVARATAGVFELAGGSYGVIVPSIPDDAVGIEWDTGGGTPIYAHESLDDIFRKLNFVYDMFGGKWELTDTGGGLMDFYRDDNATAVAQFETYDTDGNREDNPARIARRDRV